jgi:ATP-dependent DNA ligase
MFGHQDLMLCTARGKPLTRSGWLFELKYDGFRVLIAKHRKQTRLLSRRGRDMSHSFPELIACLHDLADLVIDGELVVLIGKRRPYSLDDRLQYHAQRWLTTPMERRKHFRLV